MQDNKGSYQKHTPYKIAHINYNNRPCHIVSSPTVTVVLESFIKNNMLQLWRQSHIPMHIHDHAWTTKATLTAIVVSQSLLDGVKPCLLGPDAFCCGNGPAVTAQYRTQALVKEMWGDNYSWSFVVFVRAVTCNEMTTRLPVVAYNTD